MTLPAVVVPASPCHCGSGLGYGRCCGLDWTASWPEPTPAPETGGARAALAAGDAAQAKQLLVELLERSPRHVDALALLCELCAAENRKAVEPLLTRIVRLDPNNLPATQALALLLFNKGALAEAEHHARNAVRIAPTDAQSHNLMGMIATEAQRPHVGEHHYRQAMKLLGTPSAILIANLAWNLKNQGRMAESRALYQQSLRLNPAIFQTLYGWARMEETDRNFARAGELLDAAERLSPGNAGVLLHRAILHGRVDEYDEALAALDDVEKRREGGGLEPIEWSEKGLLLDRMGRYAEAFAAFSEAKRTLRAITGQIYQAEEAAALARRLAAFF
ncbi:MAG: tetratricopeptide repeat protein, partial [Roseiarcus sp.]